MPFTSLLLTGLVPDGKFEENHVGVALVPSEQDEEETFLLFAADNSNHFHKVYLRDTLNEKSTPGCCDIVCFAHKLLKFKDGKCKPEITICFIELKGGKKDQTEKACDQILKTYEGIRAGIHKSKIEGVNIIWKALIISKSSLPQSDVSELLRDLKKTFKKENVHHIHQAAENINLTKFMKTNEIDIVKNPISPPRSLHTSSSTPHSASRPHRP